MNYEPSEPTIAKEIKCADSLTAYILIDKPQSSSYSTMKVKFDTFEMKLVDYTGGDVPFSGYTIEGGLFIAVYGVAIRKFLIFGSTSTFTDGTNTFSPANKHGFLYALEDATFDTCYTAPTGSETVSTLSDTYNSADWSFLNSGDFDLRSPEKWRVDKQDDD